MRTLGVVLVLMLALGAVPSGVAEENPEGTCCNRVPPAAQEALRNVPADCAVEVDLPCLRSAVDAAANMKCSSLHVICVQASVVLTSEGTLKGKGIAKSLAAATLDLWVYVDGEEVEHDGDLRAFGEGEATVAGATTWDRSRCVEVRFRGESMVAGEWAVDMAERGDACGRSS